MAGIKWSAAERRAVREEWESGQYRTHTYCAEALLERLPDRTLEGIRSLIRRECGNALEVAPPDAPREPGHVHPVFLDLPTREFDWRKATDLISQVQDMQHRAKPPSLRFTPASIPTQEPIALVFSADQHIGSGYTDHQRFRADMEYMLATRGLYYISVGDEGDNFTGFHSVEAVLQQVMPPALQRLFWEQIAGELVEAGKFLARCQGNHTDTFDEKRIGFSVWAEMFARCGVPTFGPNGVLELAVGEGEGAVKYTILMDHEGRGHSMYNKVHAAVRARRERFPADVTVVAHTHNPAGAWEYHYPEAAANGLPFGGMAISIKPGSYKDDEYGYRYGSTVIALPTIVFHPKEKRMVQFTDTQSAVTYLEGWRAQHKEVNA